MSGYSLSRLSDGVLLRDLHALVARDRATTAELLAHLAEVDERRLYLPAAYPSMYAWCVGKLGLCEQAAFRRIRAARTARCFPAIFPALAEGRLTLSAVLLLAPYLSRANAVALMAAAAHKNRSELERLLAERFPRPDLVTRVEPLAPAAAETGLPSPGSSEPLAMPSACQLSPATVAADERGVVELPPGTVGAPATRPRLTPLAPERYALQVTLGQRTHDKLQHARALLGHAVPSGDLAEVLDRALDALIAKLERRKRAATPRPRQASPLRSRDPRQIPAHVRRAVWARDGGRCTFVSAGGHRCGERARLEFDHVEPVARGGRASLEGLRLRCRAHNQYEAERVFGAGFMERKRQRAWEVRTQRAAAARAATEAAAVARAAAEGAAAEVVPWLRALGFRDAEARQAAGRSGIGLDAPLEERVRLALRQLAPARREPRRA